MTPTARKADGHPPPLVQAQRPATGAALMDQPDPPLQQHTTGGYTMTNTTNYAAALRRLSYNGTLDATADHPALILTQQAYFDANPCDPEGYYTANAIAPNEIDDDGIAQLWRVEWEITNPAADNEEDACNWDAPYLVQRTFGLYDLAASRSF